MACIAYEAAVGQLLANDFGVEERLRIDQACSVSLFVLLLQRVFVPSQVRCKKGFTRDEEGLEAE